MPGEPGWMGAGMWLFWILLIAIIVVSVRIVAGSGAAPPSAGSRKSALDIQRTRHTCGEIDEEEFRRRWRELER